MPSYDKETLIVVARFPYIMQAEATRIHLQDQGIPAFVAADERNHGGDVHVEVPFPYSAEARRILSGMTRRKPGDDADDACLACGAVMYLEESACARCGWTYLSGGADASDCELALRNEVFLSGSPCLLPLMRKSARPFFLVWIVAMLLSLALTFGWEWESK